MTMDRKIADLEKNKQTRVPTEVNAILRRGRDRLHGIRLECNKNFQKSKGLCVLNN